MAEPRTLGAVIRARRQDLGWSQEELARRVCVDGHDVRQSDVSRLERGKVVLPRRERLERIATALGLPLGELLGRADIVFAPAADRPPAPADAQTVPLPPPTADWPHALELRSAEPAIPTARLRDVLERSRATVARSRQTMAHSEALLRRVAGADEQADRA